MVNFVKSGDTLTLTVPYDVLSGGGIKVGNIFGVASNDALSGTVVEAQVDGVYDLPKDASAFAQGDLAYWDDTAKKVTSTVGGNILIGAVEVAALTGTAVVRINLFKAKSGSGEGVAASRQIIAGAGLTGGGDLSADRTLAINQSATVNVQTGVTYTLQAGDNGSVLTFNNTWAVTLTVPAGLGAGFNCLIAQLGQGQVTPTASGTTLHQRQSFTKTAGQYAVASLVAYAADVFALSGDLA